jgi:hypothetical protein
MTAVQIDRDDLRKFVRVACQHRGTQRLEAVAAMLDQQQGLVVAADCAVPAIDRAQLRQNVHAGGDTLVDQRRGQGFGDVDGAGNQGDCGSHAALSPDCGGRSEC